MVNTSSYWQLPSWRQRDLAMLDHRALQLWQWPAANRQPVGVRTIIAANGVQLLGRGTNAYAMSTMAAATKAMQGDYTAADGVHVTDTKFSTRLGPPPDSPPV
jgi:hypothetical protein